MGHAIVLETSLYFSDVIHVEENDMCVCVIIKHDKSE